MAASQDEIKDDDLDILQLLLNSRALINLYVDKEPNNFRKARPYFRGDARDFFHIFENGFTARGNVEDLLKHFREPFFEKSAFISTSVSKKVAAGYPKITVETLTGEITHSYVYEIRTTRPVIHVEQALKAMFPGHNFSDYSFDQERAFKSFIKPSEIRGAWRVDFLEAPPFRRQIQNQFISNPDFIPPLYAEHKLWNAGKLLNYGLTSMGVTLDAFRLFREYQLSKNTGNYDNTYREAADIAGGWAGAWTVGSAFAKAGAAICAPLTPLAAAGCGLAGGLFGSMLGYYTGSKGMVLIYDVIREKADDLDYSFPIFSIIPSAYANADIDDRENKNTANLVLINSQPKKCQSQFSQDLSTSNNNSQEESSEMLTKEIIPSTQAEAEIEVNKFQEGLYELIMIWAKEANDISGFENCPEIVTISQRLEVLQSNKAPKAEIFSAINSLKNAKTSEQAKRLNFDNSLRTVEGIVGLGTAAAMFAGNSRVANKIITSGTALVTIGKELGALAGFGTLAASVNPVFAAGNIALACANIFSLFSGGGEDKAAEAIFEELQNLKMAVENLRKEMHERFNIIETKLDKLQLDLEFKIQQVQLQNETTQLLIKQESHENKQAHNLSHQHLETLQKKVDDLYNTVRSQQITQELHAITDPIHCSLNTIDLHLTPEQYAAWLAQFRLFYEQSAYSAALAGSQSQSGDEHAKNWNLENHRASEAGFHVNELLSYLKKHLPVCSGYKNQPNILLWAYPSLAILRLILLTNNKDKALIRRNEFDLLQSITDKASEIRKFYLEIKNIEITKKLIADYRYALLQVAHEIKVILKKCNDDKNHNLNQQLCLQYKTEWLEHSNAIASQDINIRTDYPNWFYAWTKTHYGRDEHNTSAVAQPKIDYIAARKALLETIKKKPALAAYTTQAGINVLENSNQISVGVGSNLHNFPRVGIFPEDKNDPILNIWGEQDTCINMITLLNIPKSCAEAEYLGLGRLEYRYRIDLATSKIIITAYFNMGQQQYAINGIECNFSIGPYERREGILWGWLGYENVSLATAGPKRWIGSTGEARHWFDDYGYVPVLTQPDAGPRMSLVNPGQSNSRAIRKIENRIYQENDKQLAQAVANKLKEIFGEYENTLKQMALAEASLLGKALTALEAAYQRLHAYFMLTVPDCYENKDKKLAFFFTSGTCYSRSSILQRLIPQNVFANSSFLMPVQLEKLAENVGNAIGQSLLDILIEHKGKTNDNLFDLIYSQILNTYNFYKDRVDEVETYQDIFVEAKETQQRYEQVSALLNIVIGSVANEVTDPETRNKILMSIKTQMEQQGLNLGLLGDSQKNVKKMQGLQRYSFLAQPAANANNNVAVNNEHPIEIAEPVQKGQGL